MNWLLHLYPARWRERYGEEFSAVIGSQRTSIGMVLDVFAGAIDAHLHPQIQDSQVQAEVQQSNSKAKGEDTMTFAMLQRCAAGGPRLSRRDRCAGSVYAIVGALVIAGVYLLLTKLYRDVPAVQALLYASFPFTALVEEQTAYLRKRSWQTQAVILTGGFSALYVFMFAICELATKL